MDKLTEQFLELIRRAATDLPPDVERALTRARDSEEGRARSTLDWMLKNVAEARANSMPICQDTGTLIFYVDHGPDVRTKTIEAAARAAAAEATKKSYLRPNAVHPITGKNSGDNTGLGAPYLHFHEADEPGHPRVRLMLKGGGSENCGVQYTLPDRSIEAGRDLTGIKRCLLDAALKAQGFGCAPGVLGVGVGGDRMSSYMESKEQLFRDLDDSNPDPTLDGIEKELTEKINRLGIGPMGFSGKTTVLGVKLGLRHRLPASFFVSVTYMCWAYRKASMTIGNGEASYSGVTA